MNTNVHNEAITYDHEVEIIIPVGSNVRILHNIVKDETYINLWEADYFDVAVQGSVSAPSVPASYNLSEQNLKGVDVIDQNGDRYNYIEVLNTKIEYRIKYAIGMTYKMLGIVETDQNGAVLSATNYRQISK